MHGGFLSYLVSSQAQTWSFSPLEEKTYRVKATLTFWPSQKTGCDKSQLSLEVEGTGSSGFIKVELSVLWFYKIIQITVLLTFSQCQGLLVFSTGGGSSCGCWRNSGWILQIN